MVAGQESLGKLQDSWVKMVYTTLLKENSVEKYFGHFSGTPMSIGKTALTIRFNKKRFL